MKISVLGSGTSHGVPVVGCLCAVCTSSDPRDKRMRSSLYIEGAGGETVLIDAGPEFRLQAVRAGIKRLDAIFLTHAHADHTHGLDDVRPLSRDNPIPVYGNQPSIEEMKERFSYIWKITQKGGGKPKLMPTVVSAPVQIGGLTFSPVPVKHGVLDILGWEIWENNSGKSFLYLTDTSSIPESSKIQLSKPGCSRVIIIGGLRVTPHETHFSFAEALDASMELSPIEVYLTHICHNHSHNEIEEFCRNYSENLEAKIKIHPAWDNLVLSI